MWRIHQPPGEWRLLRLSRPLPAGLIMAETNTPITTAELRAAFGRARLLRLHGWTYQKALACPLVAWALQRSALAHRQSHQLPAQPRLI